MNRSRFSVRGARFVFTFGSRFAVHWPEVSPTVFMNEPVEGTRSRRHAFGAGRSDHEKRRAGQRHGVGMGAPTPLRPTIRQSGVFPACGAAFRSERVSSTRLEDERRTAAPNRNTN